MMSVYILICGEVSIRIIAAIVTIYSIEMLDYAKELKVKSDIPGVSHEHRANASARLMGVDVSLNDLGHRNENLKNPKHRNERRVHVIGSSIALGWGVPVEDGFVQRLEQRLNAQMVSQPGIHYRTINAGIGNYNTFYQVEKFKRQVDATDPDMVVLQFYINDAEPNPKGEDNAALKYSLLAAFIYQNIKSLTAVSTKSLAQHYQDLYAEDAPGWQRAKASIRELKAITDARGIVLVALLVPELHDLSKDGPFPPLYRKMGAAFTKIGVDLINPLPRFQAAFAGDSSRAWVAKNDPHPSAPAHKLLADALFDYLTTGPGSRFLPQ